MDAVMLTTIDNPYDPFSQFDDWLAFDEGKGYFTCEYLARMVFNAIWGGIGVGL